MIYIFDKKQAIIKMLTNDDFTAAHLNFKINTATTFEFSLPASKALPSGSKYVATPHPLNDSKFIMLRLTDRVDNTETIDYSAYELAYQELATDGYIEDKRPQNQSALNLMKIALNGSNWELNNVNVSGTATTNFYYVDRLSAISKVVDLLGGEILFYIEIQGNAISGRYMDYLARQGADTSKVFASGSNLLTVERQSDTSGIYTAILPRGKGKEIDNGEDDTPDGYGRRINIADVEWKKSAGSPLDKPKGSIVLSDPDATAEWGQINGNTRLLLKTYDDIDDVNVLINSAYKTLQSVNHPQIQYSATVADVGELSLGDTVLIMHGDRDLSYKTRVFEVKYDLLSPDQTELSLGDDLSSNSITSQINNLNAVADTTSSQTQWTINQIGRPSTTFGNTEPANPKVGDVFFKELPDGGTEIHRWNGDVWELLASPTTADDIAKAVTDAVSQAKTHTDEVKQGISSDIETAKSQAASLASTAEANAKSEATSQFTQAQSALSAAKSDLTNSIASEASARSQAVSSANSQAQTYANQAKSDALSAVNKEASDRVEAVNALDTKATNAVNQAKSDINDTINALSMGGRNYILNSSGMNASSTSRPAVHGNGNGASNINSTIAFNSDSITLTYTDTGTQEWYYALAEAYQNFSDTNIDKTKQYTISVDVKGTAPAVVFRGNNLLSNSFPINNTGWTRIAYTFNFTDSSGKFWLRLNSSSTNGINGPFTKGQTLSFRNFKLEVGNKATDWTPAPEDVVLDYTTKDNQIKETITQYQETNDGKVRKAQTDATTALGQITTKVSQTDYDQKTGDLSSKYTQVKQTADSQAADIVDIKKTATSQDSKINSISSDVDGTKQTISDIRKTQDSQSNKINQITNDVNGTKQSITDIQSKDGKQDARMGTIETSVSGVKSDFSSYKTTNDGVVKTAQTTAQTAVDGLKTKVSQTDYDKKTGQLQTDLTTTTQTANQAKTDIASIKQKDGEQDEKMNSIVSDANGTKQTVSDLKTTQDKQSGYISTLKQRADGFDATVTKVNNLAVGGRNLLLGTNSNTKSSLNSGNGSYTTQYVAFNNGYKYNFSYTTASTNWAVYMFSGLQKNKFNPNTNYVLSFMANVSTDIKPGVLFSNGAAKHNFVTQVTTPNILSSNGDQKVVIQLRTNSTIPDESDQSLYINGFVNKVGTFSIWDLKIETGNVPTDWSPAPEDLSGATAKAQLTADNATLSINNYKTDADGRISQAQSDIKANANAITTKVSQTDYDKKTGDLTTAVAKAQTTADGAVTTVGNYKTSNDSRVSAAETKISQNANDITLRATTADLNSAKSDLNSSISQVKITADSISNFVRDSSGNISSDFQTALSKTSIITGSTLATSIQQQTATQITSALTDNNGKIISLINQDTSGVQIAGKNIVLDGNTTVTGDFYAKGGNFKNLNASNLTVGTLNGSQVNITNVNVNSLVGNVSSFIQSNWNGKYSSTTITELGMTIGEFSKYGYDTTFDKTGMTFTTKDARYGYAKSHFGTNTIVSNSNQIVGYGTEISFGTNNGVGFDYFAIMAPGDNNLQFGKFTAPGHVSIAITSDKGLSPFFGAGVNILDDVHMAKGMSVNGDMFVNTIHGANAFNLFNIIKGQRICIPTSFRSNGTAETWLNIQM